MIHAALRWPAMMEQELWPLVMEHAIWLHNNNLKPATRFSPEELWCKSKSQHTALQHMVPQNYTFILITAIILFKISLPKEYCGGNYF
jgi:hypothetical protein